MKSTYFGLLAEFGAAEIRLEDCCEKYLGLNLEQAKRKAALYQLPVPAYRPTESQKCGWLISASDLAKLNPGRHRYMGWSLADALENSSLLYCRETGLDLEKPERRQCLYVMAAGEFMKVGITANPRQRLQELQIANPLLIELRKVYLPPSDANILRIEQIAHRALQQFHVRGEWFAIEGLKLFAGGAAQ